MGPNEVKVKIYGWRFCDNYIQIYDNQSGVVIAIVQETRYAEKITKLLNDSIQSVDEDSPAPVNEREVVRRLFEHG